MLGCVILEIISFKSGSKGLKIMICIFYFVISWILFWFYFHCFVNRFKWSNMSQNLLSAFYIVVKVSYRFCRKYGNCFNVSVLKLFKINIAFFFIFWSYFINKFERVFINLFIPSPLLPNPFSFITNTTLNEAHSWRAFIVTREFAASTSAPFVSSKPGKSPI